MEKENIEILRGGHYLFISKMRKVDFLKEASRVFLSAFSR